MNKPRSTRRAGALALCALAVVAMCARADTGMAIEYLNAEFDHYFVTASPEEAAAIDAGVVTGWQRTGETFAVDMAGDPNLSPVWRFFNATFAPKSTHVYTPYPFEYAILRQNPAWQYEGVAFSVALPAVGQCAAGRVPLYRLYNDGMGGAPNHRYTTRTDVFASMRFKGWIPEGDGNTFAFACVPPPPLAPVSTAEGVWQGSSAGGAYFLAVFLENGEAWLVYSGTTAFAGVMHGTVTSADGRFAGTFRNHDLVDGVLLTTTMSGTYSPRATLQGTAATGDGADTFTGAYEALYEPGARTSLAAGTWAGALSAHDVLTIDVSPTGAFTGVSTSGCSVTGSVVPRPSGKNVYDVAAAFGGSSCPGGSGSGRGIGIIAGSVSAASPMLLVMIEQDGFANALAWRGTMR